MKRIVTMQDISCVGKCSLTVALPVLSALGIETAVIPTAVLSTHTMFQGFTFHDLTADIEPIMQHWKKEKFTFSAVYTGYLGSFEQVDLAKKLFHGFGENALKLVDPCMADNGKLYAGFTDDFVNAMRSLCAEADIICPNLTEASLLLNKPYEETYTETDIQSTLKALTDLGCAKAVITGVSLEKGKLGAYAYDASSHSYSHYQNEEVPVRFHGTGDLWASSFLGSLLNKKSFEGSMRIACDFIRESILLTLKETPHNEYGVNFEEALPSLIQNVK